MKKVLLSLVAVCAFLMTACSSAPTEAGEKSIQAVNFAISQLPDCASAADIQAVAAQLQSNLNVVVAEFGDAMSSDQAKTFDELSAKFEAGCKEAAAAIAQGAEEEEYYEEEE